MATCRPPSPAAWERIGGAPPARPAPPYFRAPARLISYRLLFVLTVREAMNPVRHERRPSRGCGRLRTPSDLEGPEVEGGIGDVPTPELATQAADDGDGAGAVAGADRPLPNPPGRCGPEG